MDALIAQFVIHAKRPIEESPHGSRRLPRDHRCRCRLGQVFKEIAIKNNFQNCRAVSLPKSLFIDYRELQSFGKAGIRMATDSWSTPVPYSMKPGRRRRPPAGEDEGGEGRGGEHPIHEPPEEDRHTAHTFRPHQQIRLYRGDPPEDNGSQAPHCEGPLPVPGWPCTGRRQGYGRFREPEGCGTDGCTFRRLTLEPNQSLFVNSQKLRIQESPEGLRGGNSPRHSMSTPPVTLPDGRPRRPCGDQRYPPFQQRISHGEKYTIFDIYLECNSIEIAEKEFEEVQIERRTRRRS